MSIFPQMTIDAVMDEIIHRRQHGLMEKPYPTRLDVSVALQLHEPSDGFFDAFDSERNSIIQEACACRMDRKQNKA